MRAIWGREFMVYNEDKQAFHDNQYGGRRGRQPQSAILNKILTFEVIRHYGEDAAMVDNDAKACYDRILPYLTAYMLRRLGMPYFLSRFMCTVLKQMNYSIRMPKGQLASYDSSAKPIYGTGQGAGWSPPCWAVNSDIISCCMEKYAPGIMLVQPNNTTISHRHLDVFVDDTSLGVTQIATTRTPSINNSPVQRSLDIKQQLTYNMSFYNSLLKLTGGALAWEKCKAYIIKFLWKNGAKSMLKTKDVFPDLDVIDVFTQTIHKILLVNPDQAFEMLGAFVAPDGNVEDQVKVLLKKSTAWAERLNRSHLTAHEAFTAYVQVLFPSLIYPVAVLALNEEQCDKIVSPVITALLRKLNIPITTSRLLLYGPARYGGFDLPNLYVQGYILKIMMIVGHWQKSDTTATILDIVMGTSQQQVGISTSILENDFGKYGPLLNDGWVKAVWKFIDDINGKIILKDLWVPESIYRNDITLMEKIISIDIPINTQKQLNLCRLHKEYYYVTDIMDSQNQYLHPDAYSPTAKRPNMEKFPVVTVPAPYWRKWENVVKTIHASLRVSRFTLKANVDKNAGVWLQHRDKSHIIRNCGEHKFVKYKHVRSTRTVQEYTRKHWHFTSIYALDHYHIIKVYERNGNIYTDGFKTGNSIIDLHDVRYITHPCQYYESCKDVIQRWKRRIISNEPVHQPKPHFVISKTINDHNIQALSAEILEMDPVLQRNLGMITEAQDIEGLANSIEIGETIGVSDASMGSRARASHSYVLITNSKTSFIKGSAPIDCDPDDIESTRAELYGQIAIHTLIIALKHTFSLTSGEIEVYSDNKDSLCKNKLNLRNVSFPRIFRANVDLKLQIQDQRQYTKPIKVFPTHIKGHQDDDDEFILEEADLPVQCNIEMDTAAKKVLTDDNGTLNPTTKAKSMPVMRSRLEIQGSTINNNLDHHVKLHFFGPKIETRFVNKALFQANDLPKINWVAIERAFRKQPLKEKSAIFQLIHKKWYTQMDIARWNSDKNPM